jgi:hypothetical protein
VLTTQIASHASEVVGIDISATAISRTPKISNATFVTASMVDFDFSGFDVVLMFECLYYLTPEDQACVLSKIRTPLIISAPIIGANEHRKYYTRNELTKLLMDHGFRIDQSIPMSVRWDGSLLAGLATKIFKLAYRLGLPAFSIVPRRWIYQEMFVCIR